MYVHAMIAYMHAYAAHTSNSISYVTIRTCMRTYMYTYMLRIELRTPHNTISHYITSRHITYITCIACTHAIQTYILDIACIHILHAYMA